ncbi:MAG: glycerophosphodiester phosphodiesterase [Oscillospiraceae bacterium]|nr:glycerophosphodiester phosphodiesterase [Oscillospiraceae bacterium]
MNKKIIIAVSAVLAAAAGTGLFVGISSLKTYCHRKTPLTLPDGFTVTAHTGCMETEENSLESIKTGAQSGARIVEFDLYFTKDLTPVLSHGEPVGGEITLDEALKYLSTFADIRANIDIKRTDALDKVFELVNEYGLSDRVFFTGVNEDFVDAVKASCPNIEYYLNIDVDKKRSQDGEYIAYLIENTENAGAVGINLNQNGVSKELVKAFHGNGLLVSVWTVDKERDMHKILELSPDNITTREPGLLCEIIKERSSKI